MSGDEFYCSVFTPNAIYWIRDILVGCGDVLESPAEVVLYEYVRCGGGYLYYGVLYQSVLPLIKWEACWNGSQSKSIHAIVAGVLIYKYTAILCTCLWLYIL